MRDILIVAIAFGSIPLILFRPWIGVLVWSWLGYMNPHRLTWGFAHDFPFAMIIGSVTLVALVFNSEKKRFPITGLIIVWILWIFWMNVTTQYALFPSNADPEWNRAMKIQLFAIVTILLMCQKMRLNALVWVIVFSLGFYGVKGGIFSILTGGQYLVLGPEGSFIGGNNSVGLALVMTIPLMWYLRMQSDGFLLRWGFLGAMGLTALAIFTTDSRGAFLAIGAMCAFLWLKSKQKVGLGLGIICILTALFFAMPAEWQDRMMGISDYQEDGSAMGRINAWWMAFNLAKDHPLVGGGFGTFRTAMFAIYAPDPEDFHDAHSIYFEVLGEHGFVGLTFFLMLGYLALRTGGRIIRQCRGVDGLQWASDLAAMLQASLVAYLIGGAFLGLAYFDLYYQLIAMLVVTRLLVEDHLKEQQAASGVPGISGIRGFGAAPTDHVPIARSRS